MSENLNPDQASLDARIKAADPAANLEAPHASLIHRAIESDTIEGTRKPSRFVSPKARRTLIGGLSTAGVFAVALTFAATSLLGAGQTGNHYLFSLAGGATGGAQKMAAASSVSSSDNAIAGGTAATMDICRGFDGSPCGTMPSQFVYHADSGLSTATPSAQVYKLVPNKSPNQTLTAVAAAFDVTGTSRTFDSPDSTWTTFYKGQSPDGSEGYGKPTVSVSFDTKAPMPSWNYQGPQMLYTDCAHQEAGAKGQDVPIVDPNAQDANNPICLAGISGRGPTTAEAVARTKAIFKSIGYDSGTNLKSLQDGDLYLEVPQDPNTQRNSVNINGYLIVGGQITTMSMTVGWDGSSKDVGWGYGFDATAKSQGSFGTVSAKSAVDRLGDWKWFGNPYLDYSNLKYSTVMNPNMDNSGAGAVTYSASTTAGVVAPDATISSGSAASSGATSSDAPSAVPAPLPSDAVATPEPVQTIDVTVTRAESTLMTVYAADGSVWFVPGFVYYDSTGYVGNVLSIVEGVIQLPEVTPMTDFVTK